MEMKISNADVFAGHSEPDACADMLLALTSGWTIKQVVDYAHKLLINPVVLYTRDGKYLYCSGEDTGTRSMLSSLLMNMDDPERFEEIARRRRTQVETGVEGIYFDHYDIDNGARSTAMSGLLVVDDKPVGLLFTKESRKKIEASEAAILKVFCSILSDKLSNMSLDVNINDKFSAEKEGTDVNAGTKWLRSVGGHRFQNFYVAVAEVSNLSNARIDALKEIPRRSVRFFRIVIHEAQAIILFNIEDDAQAEAMRGALLELCGTMGVSVGLSGSFSSTQRLHSRYLQALRTLNTGRFLGLDSKIYEFEKLGSYVLLYEFIQAADLDCYRSESLDRLCELDLTTGSEYYSTLHRYLSCNGSKQRTSEALKIHRNTLTYRLERIESILGYSIDDSETQLRLWFLLKVKQVLDKVERQNA